MTGKRTILLAVFALAAVAVALAARGGAEAQTFRPYNTYSLTDTTPGANSNSALGFGVPAPDYNYEDASMTTLSPVDGMSANGLEAPIGARVGTLSALATVALIGGQCNSALTPNFILKNSSVDIADELTDTSWILKPAATVPVPDTDGDGLYDYEEQYPWFLNDMLDPDGSGPLLPLQPRARFAGHTSVAGFNVIVQFLLFNPGQLAAAGGIYTQMGGEKGIPSYVVLDNPVGEGEATPGAIGDFCTPLATTTTLYGVTQDNPLTVGTDESGYNRQTNPAAATGVLLTGTHMGYNYSQSERNFDGDYIENDLDGCRYTNDPLNWDPRVGPPCVAGSNPGDQDCDSLPSSCDNAANGGNDTVYNNDQDADGYDNAQDNCPLTKNGCKDSSCGPIFNAAWDNQDDNDAALTNTDLGPRSDAIGDSCDDSDDDGNEDGAGAGTCNDGIDNGGGDLIDANDPDCTAAMDKVDVPTSGNPPDPFQGTYYHGYAWDAVCVGSTDGDNDGYCDTLELILGSPTNNGPETGAECDDAVDGADADGVINDGCPYVGKYAESGVQCANATDDDPGADGKVNDGCPVIGVPENLVIDATITAPLALPTATAAQSCSDGIDNDDDGTTDTGDVGCQAAAGESGAECDNAIDDDGDTAVNDGCPAIGNPEDPAANECADDLDENTLIPNDEGDAAPDKVNDGCPVIPVHGDTDNDGWADDADVGFDPEIAQDHAGPEIVVRDGTLADGTYDYDNTTGVIKIGNQGGSCYILRPDAGNDGDPLDLEAIVACMGEPRGFWQAADIEEDGAGDPAPDGDDDIYWIKLGWWVGVDPTGTDNCPTVWNPTQTNTDAALQAAGASVVGDALGDACDDDDDNDGFTDAIEAHLPTDPLDNCSNGAAPNKSDAWGLDQDKNKTITVVGDVLPYSGNIGASVSGSPPTSWAKSRLDLDGNRTITVVGDVLKYSGKIGTPCN